MDNGIDGDEQQHEQRGTEGGEHPWVVVIDLFHTHPIEDARIGEYQGGDGDYQQEQEADAEEETDDDGNGDKDAKQNLQQHGEDGAQGAALLHGLLVDNHVGQTLGCHLLSFHLQHLLWHLRLRNHDGQHDIEHNENQFDRNQEEAYMQQLKDGGNDAERGQEQHYIAYSPPDGIGAGIGGKA